MHSELSFAIDPQRRVSGLLLNPPHARFCYLFAHGAGAGMAHPSMQTTADALAARGVATLRFNFHYLEQGAKRPDPPALCHKAIRAAHGELRQRLDAPLFAGGRSFGGRMISQAQALTPLEGVRGLIFLGFPLHPAHRPGIERARHLTQVNVPMLFVQGSRDALADLNLLTPVVNALGARAELKVLESADHSFAVPAKTGRTAAQVRVEAVDAMVEWMARHA